MNNSTHADKGASVVTDPDAPGASETEQLVAAYRDYCESQVSGASTVTTVTAIRRLATLFQTHFPADIEAYWNLNDRMFEIWQRSVGRVNAGNSRIFKTTGSTRGASRVYPFGPHPELWIQAIWELTRYPLGWRTIVKLQPLPNPHADLTVRENPQDIYQYVIQCGPLRQSLVGELVRALQDLLSQHAPISLITVPDSFLYLNRQPAFQEFAIAHRERFNLMSQNWEPFYARQYLQQQGVHINDALGDWSTGLFYSTCRAGFLHTLPTCGISGKDRVNLLNLMPTPELGPGTEEDLFEPVSISRCACGRNRLDFRFVPHQATALRPPIDGILYDPGLAERLESSFRTLQFIQEAENLYIRYQVEGEMRDSALLEDYFRPHGYRIQFQPNDCYIVGNKRPVFYRYPS